MAEDVSKWHAPLKAPAVEIVDLEEEEQTTDSSLGEIADTKLLRRDASEGRSEDGDSQWSMYEDLLEEELYNEEVVTGT